jgi:hypothetical protein
MSRALQRWLTFRYVGSRVVLIVGVICGIPCLLAMFWPLIEGYAIYLPNERDPRLVGTWHGSTTDFANERIQIVSVLAADGTGMVTDPHRRRPFQWGTHYGILYTKWMAVDYWAHHSFRYRLDSSDQSVTFDGARRLDVICLEMQKAGQ